MEIEWYENNAGDNISQRYKWQFVCKLMHWHCWSGIDSDIKPLQRQTKQTWKYYHAYYYYYYTVSEKKLSPKFHKG